MTSLSGRVCPIRATVLMCYHSMLDTCVGTRIDVSSGGGGGLLP